MQPPGVLAPGLGVAPSALPRLQATPDGGLIVGYRVHRQLPLMTYYWEAAVQVLDASGWRSPITFTGTDATLEEVSLAPTERGVVLATQSDGRLERALHWTEGFGGRECPYLADHHGAVIWHGVHGAGQVVLATVESRRAGGFLCCSWVAAVRAAALGRAQGGPALGAGRSPTGALPGAGRRGDLPPVLGRSAPALAGQPLHLRRRAVPRGLLPLRLGRRRVRLLGGHRPRRELHRLPVVEHPEDRRPAARARALRAALRVRVDVGRSWPPERHLRRRRPGRADLLGVRRRQHHAGRPVARARRTPGVPRDHHPAPPRLGHGLQRLGLPRPRGTAGSSRCSRPAAATTRRRCASARTPTAPRAARS